MNARYSRILRQLTHVVNPRVFNGTSDSIDVGSIVIPAGQPYRIETRLRPNRVDATQRIVSQGTTGISGRTYLTIVSSGEYRMFANDGTSGISVDLPAVADEWATLIAEYDGSNLSLEVNGVRNSLPVTYNIQQTSTVIGRDETGRFFDGDMSYVRIEVNGVLAYDNHLRALEQRTFATFDGVNDYFDAGDSDAFSFGDSSTDRPFSIAAWIRMDDSSRFRITSKSRVTSSEYLFTTNAAHNLLCYLYDPGPGNSIGARSSAALDGRLGEWIHVVATYDGSSNVSGVKIYIDGTEDTIPEISGSYTAMHNTSGSLAIGRWEDVDSFANGDIEQLVLYDRVLTQLEILELANRTAVPPGAIVRYEFDESSGTTLTDKSGRGNHATLNGDTGANVWNSEPN